MRRGASSNSTSGSSTIRERRYSPKPFAWGSTRVDEATPSPSRPITTKFSERMLGSGYRLTGINFEGPTPRPLERARVVLADDGQILVDKSRHFQYELGQWTDPEAFLKV